MKFHKKLTIKIYFFTFLLFHFLSYSYALFEYKEIFANSAGLCGAFSSEEQSPAVIYYNPAGIFNIPKYSLSFSNTNLYGLSQLSNNTFCFATEIKSLGKVGFMYNSFGFELYKENLMCFTYANSLKDNFSFGMNIKSLAVDIKNYGSKSFLSFDVGVLARPHYKLLTSCVVKNINSVEIAEDESVQKELVVAGKIQFIKNIFSYIDVIKNPQDPIFFRIGEEIRYDISDRFLSVLRAGVETATEFKPAKYSFGFGLVYKINNYEIIFDYSYLNHIVLGGQHLVSLGFNFGKKQEVYYEEEKPVKKTKAKTKTSEEITTKTTKEKLPTKPINLNTATAQELAQLPGIGPSTAQKIVEYRQQIGKFTSLEQLLEVPRVGSLTLQRIKPYVVIEDINASITKEENVHEQKKIVEEKVIKETPQPLIQQPQVEQKIIDEKKEISQEIVEFKVVEKEPSISEKKYNLNTITEDELKSLGFTSTEAKNILRYRTRFGKFNSVEEIYKVPNVNRKTIDKIKNLLYVE